MEGHIVIIMKSSFAKTDCFIQCKQAFTPLTFFYGPTNQFYNVLFIFSTLKFSLSSADENRSVDIVPLFSNRWGAVLNFRTIFETL